MIRWNTTTTTLFTFALALGACDREEPAAPRSLEVAGGDECGGFLGLECPAGQVCADDPSDDCDPDRGGADCPGICEDTHACGGFLGLQCPEDLACIDDPGDDCHPDLGGDDCIGICVPHCAGFLGLGCPDGSTCVDDPGDDCYPTKGGADCTGICIPD